MPRLHIFLDSPADTELTKTELDIGLITQPYVDIAHCIRAGFCVSHDLRKWVRITIGFDYQDPYSLMFDPTTIRYMGTDERSILHIILRAQASRRQSKKKVPHGVTISELAVRDTLVDSLNEEKLLLIPADTPTWTQIAEKYSDIVMFCPLFDKWDESGVIASNLAQYAQQLPRDVAILEVVHALDTL